MQSPLSTWKLLSRSQTRRFDHKRVGLRHLLATLITLIALVNVSSGMWHFDATSHRNTYWEVPEALEPVLHACQLGDKSANYSHIENAAVLPPYRPKELRLLKSWRTKKRVDVESITWVTQLTIER